MDKNGIKLAKKWPKTAQNASKWSEMLSQMVQMRQGIPTPIYLNQNDGKLQKKIPKLP